MPTTKPDPLSRPAMNVEDLPLLLPISRSAAYQACRLYLETDGSHGIPCIRVGKRIVVPTAPIRRMLGLDDAA